jgi:ABC-type Fe3+-hydroxamate transport system substrate-binding protein
MSGGALTRRHLLGLAGAAAAFAATPARSRTRERIAIVDWALLETALALGVRPTAAVELVLFRQLAVEPHVPDSVVDLGLRGSINFELLATIAPDRIYGSNYSAWANPIMQMIAPVRSLPIYEGEPPYAKAEAAMRAMADDFGMEATAHNYITGLDAELEGRQGRLEKHRERPLLIINIGDSRHFRAFGGDSMFGDAASRMGFSNAWGPRTSYSATAPIGIETLAKYPDATIVIIAPVPPDAKRVLPQSPLWNAMPAVRAGRVLTLEAINPFGGLPAARRFARLLEAAMGDAG